MAEAGNFSPLPWMNGWERRARSRVLLFSPQPASKREKEISAMSGMRSCYDFSLCLADARRGYLHPGNAEDADAEYIFINLIRRRRSQPAARLDADDTIPMAI